MTDEMFRDLFDNVVICGRYPYEKLLAMKSYMSELSILVQVERNKNESLHQENKVLKDAIKEAIDYIKTTQYSDVAGLNKYSILEFWFIKDVLEILERTDK